MQDTRQIGLIGLGLVGKAMARRLIQFGFEVTGYDIDPAACAAAAALGVTVAQDAVEVARERSHPLLLSLPDSDVVSEVLWGQGAVGAALPAGATVLDTTTGRPADAIENHRRLAERGVRFVDVTLSGSSESIGAGEATALIGGSESEADYREAVACVASTIFFLGQPGAGCMAKLVVNLVMGINRAALAEGLAFAEAAGLDPEQALEVLRGSFAYSRVIDAKGERMIRRDFSPASRITQHAKDVRLILETAGELGLSAPLEQAHAELLRRAIDAGWGGLDTAALIKVYTDTA